MEFEGKTEKEAIDKAVEELGLERDEFDVEIIETRKATLFKKGYVKIKVHVNQPEPEEVPEKIEESDADAEEISEEIQEFADAPYEKTVIERLEAQGDFEVKVLAFLDGLLKKMDYPGDSYICFRKENKIGIMVETEFSGILIGKKGKNLDAIQILVNVYAGRLLENSPRIIVDVENYRGKREDNLVKLALHTAELVRKTKRSKLLEPMNPFERRIIHTTLNEMEDIATKSDGDGIFKQVRVIYREQNR